MNRSKRHKQFMLESNILHHWAIDRAEYLNERCWNLTEQQAIDQGPEMLKELNYFEGRLQLEEKLLDAHMEKYRDIITDEGV